MKRVNEIIRLARGLRNSYGKDPFAIAEVFGFNVICPEHQQKDFTAHTLKLPGISTTIVVNGDFSPLSQTMLCAHELGHAILHDEEINHFRVTRANMSTNVEYEANLFAVALLFDDDDFNRPITKMDNYTLKTILDFNIREL